MNDLSLCDSEDPLILSKDMLVDGPIYLAVKPSTEGRLNGIEVLINPSKGQGQLNSFIQGHLGKINGLLKIRLSP